MHILNERMYVELRSDSCSVHLLLVEFLLNFLFVTGIVDDRSGQLHLDVSQPGTQAAHFLFQLLNSYEGLPQLLHPDRRQIRSEQTFSRGKTLLHPTHHLGTQLDSENISNIPNLGHDNKGCHQNILNLPPNNSIGNQYPSNYPTI